MQPTGRAHPTGRPRCGGALQRLGAFVIACSVLVGCVTDVPASARTSSRRTDRAPTGLGPTTRLHYAPNGNFGRHGVYVPRTDGFNLADVDTPEQLASLPAHVRGLIFVGLCHGADAQFVAAVRPFVGKRKVYGFYLYDEPDPPGRPSDGPHCRASKLKAESDWLHKHAPSTITFIVLDNEGSERKPDYRHTYTHANTHIDLFGLDPYPCQPQLHGCDDRIITAAVTAARKAGIARRRIVPVYQAFGGGDYSTWTLPTPKQERALLRTWRALVGRPRFDYAYSWGTQGHDRALTDTPRLRSVFAEHNAS